MKKIGALLLALAFAFSFMACGQENSSQDASGGGQTADQSYTEVDETDREDKQTNAQQEKMTFDGMTAIDNDECAIEISEIDPDGTLGYTLKAKMENKSADKTYMFAVENASINGVECEPFFATEITAGKKANEEITFYGSEMEQHDIGTYTDIAVHFRVYDSDDWNADAVADETIHVYPYGEERAKKFVRENQPNDQVLVDNENVSVIVTGYEENDTSDYLVNLFLVNKTDREMSFSFDDVSVNGYMMDPLFIADVSAGNCRFSSIQFYDSDLESNDISSVEEIEGNFRVYDKENWDAEDFFNENIVLNPGK